MMTTRRAPKPPAYAAKAVAPIKVPRLWPGSTIVCIASGPSLTAADAEYCRGKAKVIAINNAYKLAMWADVLYACDAKWWRWAHTDKGRHPDFQHFRGLKYGLMAGVAQWPGVQRLKHTGADGLERHPAAIRHGSNSGYQAINLAMHFGAKRIILIGYDMGATGRKHFDGDHPDGSAPPFAACLRHFATLVEPLKAAGVEVINCTRKTALTCFPQMPIEQALSVAVEAFA